MLHAAGRAQLDSVVWTAAAATLGCRVIARLGLHPHPATHFSSLPHGTALQNHLQYLARPQLWRWQGLCRQCQHVCVLWVTTAGGLGYL